MKAIIIFSVFLSLFMLMGASSCSHTKYKSSFSAGVDEVIFFADEQKFEGIAGTRWVDELNVRVPNEKNVWITVRADSWSEKIDVTYPYTTIPLPNNGAKVVSIGIVSDTLKVTGTLYREDDDYQLQFKAKCGEIMEVNGVGACQLPVNASLDIEVDVDTLGRVVILSSMCNFKEIREGVSGPQSFKITGALCPIIIKVDDVLGPRYGGFLLRTATDSYIPIKSPKTRVGKICAPYAINYMEQEHNDKIKKVKRNRCIKKIEGATYWLWDLQNARMRRWTE